MTIRIGGQPTFVVVGEASKINLVYVEGELSSTTYPVVKNVGIEGRTARGLRVNETIKHSGGGSILLTQQYLYETLFLSKKNKIPILHLKPDREFGYVMNYLDIRVAKYKSTYDRFTYESYARYDLVEPVYLFTDYNENEFRDEDIPRLILEAPGPVYVSTRRRNLSLFEGAAGVVISEFDFKNATSLVSNLIVTLGGSGASHDDKIYPTEEHTGGDNLGCRETFFAMFSQAHYYTKDFKFSIEIANTAASDVAKHRSLPKINIELVRELRKKILNYTPAN